MIRIFITFASVIAIFFLNIAQAAPAQKTELWEQFKSAHYDESGRITDYRPEGAHVTSESQSYGLFFALIAGDREAFDRILNWTEKNLAAGSLEKNSPAWIYGPKKDPQSGEVIFEVLDRNNATDADLWIVYSLLEAARLWNEPAYRDKALAMLKLLDDQVVSVKNLGKVLLPGRIGFTPEGLVRLNPSYLPPFVLKRIATEVPHWDEIRDGSFKAVLRSSPDGFSPDWAFFDKEGKLVPQKAPKGSWDAIRTYLWIGMMSHEDPASTEAKGHFKNMELATKKIHFPPEEISVINLKIVKPGEVAFGAALLPLLTDAKTKGFIRAALKGRTMEKTEYYRNALTVFGLGFDNRVFAFDAGGKLILPSQNPALRGLAQ